MVRHVLAIVNPLTSLVHLSTGDVERVFRCGIKAVDFCWPVVGQKDWRERRAAIERYAAIAVACGLDIRTHFWAGRRGADGTSNADEAWGRHQGEQLGTEMMELGEVLGVPVVSCGANAERDVHRGKLVATTAKGTPIYAHHAGGFDYLHGFFDEFFGANSIADAPYVGFAVLRKYYAKAKYPDELKGRSRLLHGMIYQSSYDDLDSNMGLIREEWPEHRLSAFIGIGRRGSDGVVVGNAEAIRRIAAERLHGVEELVHYCGNEGAWMQLLAGRPDYPSVAAMVAAMITTERDKGIA